MNKINGVDKFLKLNKANKISIYDREIKRIETYIHNSRWYQSADDELKYMINTYNPWKLYKTATDTPVRLYGFAKDDNDWIYLIATMEDDENNTLSTGQICDINLIEEVTWANLSRVYINNLIKAKSYGGDVLFLKPEMFLVFGKYI